MRAAPPARVQVYNCLPATLAHYARELKETLARLGVEAHEVQGRIPIDSPRNRIIRAASHISVARKIARSGIPTIVIWPAFGWLDGILWIRSRSTVLKIAHDPVPLRRQYFTGQLWHGIARRVRSADWLCHTDSAANASLEVLGTPPHVALHPVLSAPISLTQPRTGSRYVVSVLGQFKPSRDLEVLGRIAKDLSTDKYELKIVGRGWPRIEGWNVTDRFVTEDELDCALDESHVVLIPYRKYWQSGIAVRAVERGIPVVGERTDFLANLMGHSYPGLITDGDLWADAIEAVVGHRDAHVHETYIKAVDESWRPILALLK